MKEANKDQADGVAAADRSTSPGPGAKTATLAGTTRRFVARRVTVLNRMLPPSQLQ